MDNIKKTRFLVNKRNIHYLCSWLDDFTFVADMGDGELKDKEGRSYFIHIEYSFKKNENYLVMEAWYEDSKVNISKCYNEYITDAEYIDILRLIDMERKQSLKRFATICTIKWKDKEKEDTRIKKVFSASNVDAAESLKEDYFRHLKDDEEIEEFSLCRCILYVTKKPSFTFVKKRISAMNNTKLDQATREGAKKDLIESIKEYQPSFEESKMKDIIDYCRDGKFHKLAKEYEKVYGVTSGAERLIDDVLDELDGELYNYN